jgi:phosphatidylethanolamine/phosphatidyl-N-methylethanolamine N-methyltransferase
MSVLFLKRFLQRPMQVASIVPSSRTLVNKVAGKLDYSQPRVVAEFGPGEGVHTRELAKRMSPDSTLLLFELDAELADHLRHQFRDDRRVAVLNTTAADLPAELAKRGFSHCDYVVSGIPFSILDKEVKRQLLRNTYEALKPESHSAFVIYQVTNELTIHCRHFPRVESEYCLRNIPPMFVTKYYKLPKSSKNGSNGHNGTNGHNGNGNGKH